MDVELKPQRITRDERRTSTYNLPVVESVIPPAPTPTPIVIDILEQPSTIPKLLPTTQIFTSKSTPITYIGLSPRYPSSYPATAPTKRRMSADCTPRRASPRGKSEPDLILRCSAGNIPSLQQVGVSKLLPAIAEESEESSSDSN